jgi:hypothetical protein
MVATLALLVAGDKGQARLSALRDVHFLNFYSGTIFYESSPSSMYVQECFSSDALTEWKQPTAFPLKKIKIAKKDVSWFGNATYF